MNRHKKDFPIVVLNTIEGFLSKDSEHYKVIDPGNFLAKIEDYDGKFYFNVKNYEIKNGVNYWISYKPRNQMVTDEYEVVVKENELTYYFDKWAEIVKDYEKVNLYDDPITKKYQEEFYNEFRIIDPNAEIEPFDLSQQLFIDEYIEKSLEIISKLATSNQEIDAKEFKEIEAEAIQIKNNLTRESKNRILERLSKFRAKTRKAGLPILKEVFIKVSVEISKKLLGL